MKTLPFASPSVRPGCVLVTGPHLEVAAIITSRKGLPLVPMTREIRRILNLSYFDIGKAAGDAPFSDQSDWLSDRR